MHHWMVTCRAPFKVTLAYDTVSRIIVSGAYCIYDLRWEAQVWCVDSSLDGGVVYTFLAHFDLDIDF